jgi:multidrug efflux system membrane fusion protein
MAPFRLALTVATALALAACGKPPEGGPPGEGGGGAPEVTTAAVVARPVSESQELPGRLEAVDSVQVRSRVTGTITGVHFVQGAEVRRGDLLFTIDARPFEAARMRAEGELAALRARLDQSRSDLARNETLLASQAISQQEVEQKAAQLRDYEASAKAAQAAVAQAQLDVEYSRIVAPISGRVGRAEITPGNLVTAGAGEGPVLTTIVSTTPIYVGFDADEATFLRFKLRATGPKQKVPVKIALGTESEFTREAMLDYVDNRVDPSTGSVRLRATLPNADGTLVPGLYARVKLVDPTGAKEAVLIPDQAVGTDQDRKFVFVVGADGTAQPRPVKLAGLEGNLRVVLDGLKPGEQVIVNGLMRVRPGVPVKATAAPAGGAAPGGGGAAAAMPPAETPKAEAAAASSGKADTAAPAAK